MNEPFDSHSRNFGELLGQYEKRPVIVPQFQRGYSWEKNHVSAFWADLLDFHNNQVSKKATDKYFLGPIVIMPHDKHIILLDGQQRLATATILFASLRDIVRSLNTVKGTDLARDIQRDLIENEEGRYSLALSEIDETYFLKTIKQDPPTSASPRLRSHALIKSAKEFLSEAVKQHISGYSQDEIVNKLKDLRDTLATSVAMIAISVNSEDDAFLIFETLNDRGLRLSVPDLLLNYLMRMTGDVASRGRVRERWNFMLEKMGRRDIDRFLRHMWLSKYGDVKARGLFREIKEYLQQNKIQSVQFSDACADECEQYVALIDLNRDILGRAYQYAAALVKYLDVPSSLPLLLAGMRCLSPVDFSKLSMFTVTLVVRRSVIANLNPSELESAFYEAARLVRSLKEEGKTSAKTLQLTKEILRRVNPQDSELLAKVENLTLTRGEAQYIITTLANKLQSKTREIAIDQANLEHIFPLNPASSWQNVSEMEPMAWHIGNLTILGDKLNRDAANSDFKTKSKRYYTKSEIKMTSEIATKYKKWTPVQVLGRAQSMVKPLIETWQTF